MVMGRSVSVGKRSADSVWTTERANTLFRSRVREEDRIMRREASANRQAGEK